MWWSDGNKGWRGAGGALAGWVLLKLSCQDVTWDPSALCHQLRQALAPWEVQKSRSFRRSHQVLLSCGGIVSEQGLGMAWGAHTVHTGSEVGSGAALELPHLTEIKVLNLQLMVMVTKMWLFPWEELVQPSPCCAWRVKWRCFILVGKSHKPQNCPFVSPKAAKFSCSYSGKLMGSVQIRESLDQHFGETEAMKTNLICVITLHFK